MRRSAALSVTSEGSCAVINDRWLIRCNRFRPVITSQSKVIPSNGRMKWPTPVCRWWPRTSELWQTQRWTLRPRLLPPFSCCFALRRAAWFNQATNSIAEPGRNKKRNLLCLICCARRRPSLSEGRPIKCHLFAGNRIVGVDWRRKEELTSRASMQPDSIDILLYRKHQRGTMTASEMLFH